MSRVERFEDLIAWQKARELTKRIYAVTRQADFAKDFRLKDQIQRAAVSIMSNIAEGFERGGRAEFHQFLSTAKVEFAEESLHPASAIFLAISTSSKIFFTPVWASSKLLFMAKTWTLSPF